MKRLTPFLYFTLAAFAAAAPFYVAPPQAVAQQQHTLYQRLGGYDALAAVTDISSADSPPIRSSDDFLPDTTRQDDSDSRAVIDFLCVATGGPCAYTGQDMKTAHTGLGINDADWDASVKHLVATLDKFHVPKKRKAKCSEPFRR